MHGMTWTFLYFSIIKKNEFLSEKCTGYMYIENAWSRGFYTIFSEVETPESFQIIALHVQTISSKTKLKSTFIFARYNLQVHVSPQRYL
jgi:hypothetical protein